MFDHNCAILRLRQLLKECNHENVVRLVKVHIDHVDRSLYLVFEYAEHDLYVSALSALLNKVFILSNLC